MNTPKVGRSKQAKRDKEVVITFHSDNATGSDAHPAVNVKYQSYLNAGEFEETATPKQREQAWESVVTTFWNDAALIAEEYGYSGVFSEGRSSGWLVPYTQHDARGTLIHNWTGQGPEKGYPVFPDVYVSRERRTFVAFRRKIEALLETVPDMFQQEIKSIIESEGKYHAS